MYNEYIDQVLDHYSTVSTQSNHNLRNLIRLWLYLLTRDYSADSKVVEHLEKTNPQDGWYRLERCPLDIWIDSIQRT